MIDVYMKEYIAIVDFLSKTDAFEGLVKNNEYILISKDRLVELLDGNMYDTSHNKLCLWRDLHWIDAKAGGLTKQMRCGDGKRIRGVQINIQIAKTLKEHL